MYRRQSALSQNPLNLCNDHMKNEPGPSARSISQVTRHAGQRQHSSTHAGLKQSVSARVASWHPQTASQELGQWNGLAGHQNYDACKSTQNTHNVYYVKCRIRSSKGFPGLPVPGSPVSGLLPVIAGGCRSRVPAAHARDCSLACAMAPRGPASCPGRIHPPANPRPARRHRRWAFSHALARVQASLLDVAPPKEWRDGCAANASLAGWP